MTKQKEKPLRVEWQIQEKGRYLSGRAWEESYHSGDIRSEAALLRKMRIVSISKPHDKFRAVRVEIYAVTKKGKR